MTEQMQFDGASMLPHGQNARFICGAVDVGADTLVCTGTIPVESPFAQGGIVPGFVLLEFAAQAAALEALARSETQDARPRVGYLVRAHGLRWTAAGVAAGSPLTTRVHREDAMPPLYTYRATVTASGVELFVGEFSIYVEA